MPYTAQNGGFERASALGHVPTVAHPLVQHALGRYLMPAQRTGDVAAITDSLIDPASLAQPPGEARWTIATDASPFEAEVDPHFPSTRVLFLQLAAVIVDITKMRERSGPFADPAAIREAQHADVMAGVLPSSNLMRSDGTDPQRAFREEVLRLFERSTIEGRSMLDVLLEVEAERLDVSVPKGTLVMHRCPNPDCGVILDDESKGYLTPVGAGGGTCPVCGDGLLPTDALRVHEKFSLDGSNMEACGRVMSIAERLILLALLGHLQTRRPSVLGQMAFITDGPLALFGEVAPIKRPLLRRWQRVTAEQAANGFGLPVVVGLEKSGQFAEHALAIHEYVPRGRLMVLTDDYVQTYITHRGSTHGEDTYYGRHFFYHSKNGSMFTMTVPPLGRLGASPTDQFSPADFPTLRATCDVLDRIGTRLYENATIPVALAHRWCAYPLAQATEVLKLHAEEHLDRR